MLSSLTRLLAKQSVTTRCRGASVLWWVLAVMLAGVSFSAIAEPLSFHDALASALRETPLLRASQAQTQAARQAAIPAGELPDPKLALGIDNLPIEGADRYSLTSDFMTMQRIGLMQEFPNAAKRDARRQGANAKVALMAAYEQVARQTVLRGTAQAWIARRTVEYQLSLLDELVAENRLFDAAVRAQLAAGKGAAIDAVMPRQEAAAIAQRRDELTAQLARTIAQLRRWLGTAADAPLAGEVPEWLIHGEQLQLRLHQHPELALFLPKTRVLDAEITEATAAKRPDWALEFAYQKRGPEFGDMVMLQVSIDLPFFSGSRQDPLIAAKQAERQALTAEQEALLRERAALLDAELAEYQQLQQTQTRIDSLLLPLATEKVALAMAAWRAGKGALTDVIAARRERIETQLNAIAVTGARQQMAANLHYGYGDLGQEFTGLQP